MPIYYSFNNHKNAETVAKALLFVAKFSKKQSLVRFTDYSVGIIWGGSPIAYFIHAESSDRDMFKKRNDSNVPCTVIQVNPSILGKTLKGGSQDRNITVTVIRPNKIQVSVEYADSNKRTIVHTIPCEVRSMTEYQSMLIQEVEKFVVYDTKSYLDNIHRFKHIIDSFVRLNIPRVHIFSKESPNGNELVLEARTQGSDLRVNITDLDNDCSNMDMDYATDRDESIPRPRRRQAGVSIDTKKLAFFLSSLLAQKRSKVCFEIEHLKCLKITLNHEISLNEKLYQSVLLLHSLNS